MHKSIFRKPRFKSGQMDRNPISKRRREITKLVTKSQSAEALSALDAWAAEGAGTCEVMCYMADVLFKQCKYNNASDIYERAANLSKDDLSLNWLRAVVGQVRSVLKTNQFDAAYSKANGAAAIAQARWSLYFSVLNQAQTSIVNGGSASIPSKPESSRAFYARIAKLFFVEGDLVHAQQLWQQSAMLGDLPEAFLGLAEIALLGGDYTKASDYSIAALKAGKFGAKTVSAWKTLLQAESQSVAESSTALSLVSNLDQVSGSVKARSVLMIVKTMRDLHYGDWMQLANKYISSTPSAKYPIISAEITKLILATVRRDQSQAINAKTAATALLAMDKLSPGEYVCAAKAKANSAGILNESVEVTQIVTNAINNYGEGYRPVITHSLALSFIKNGNVGYGITLLQGIVGLGQGVKGWSKATWALAKAYEQNDNYALASQYYGMLADAPTVDQRYRLLSQLKWIGCLINTGQVNAVQQAQAKITSILTGNATYDVILDTARQVFVASDILENFANQLFDAGVAKARLAIAQNVQPSAQINCRFRLARRQKDFARYSDITTDWEQLGDARKDELWNCSGLFWEYVSVVAFAYKAQGQQGLATSLLNAYLDDVATPLEGKALLLVTKGEDEIYSNEIGSAVDTFNKAISLSPSTLNNARAYYWLSLYCFAKGKLSLSAEYAKKVCAMLVNRRLGWQKALTQCSALMLESFLHIDAPTRTSNSADEAAHYLATLKNDLDRVSNS